MSDFLTLHPLPKQPKTLESGDRLPVRLAAVIAYATELCIGLQPQTKVSFENE